MKEFYLAISKCQFAKQQHTHVRAIISLFLCLSTNKTFTGFDIDYAGIFIISIYLSPFRMYSMCLLIGDDYQDSAKHK
jgi:hypothetical protein